MSPSQASTSQGASLSDRYRVLLEIGRTLTGTLSLDELFRAIYHETRRVLEADGFYISLCSPSGEHATIVFFADRGEEERVDVSYPAASSTVIRTGRGVRVDDELAGQSLMLLGDDVEEVTRSALSAPLRWEGKVIGAISTQSYRPAAFTDDDLELLQGIADMAAVAVNNARHIQLLERRSREAREIEEIGRAMASSLDPDEVMARVIDATVRLLRADGAAVWMFTDGAVARVHAAGGDITLPAGLEWNLSGRLYDELVGECRSTRVDDLALSPLVPVHLREYLSGGAGIACPLIVSSSVVGVLAAGSRQPRRFDAEDGEVLERLASQASVALENARLHQSLQSLSLTDPLTGLPNRRHLSVHLEREVAAARRGRPLIAIIFDLDSFKVFNDSHGHLAGDEALKAFSGILQDENRAMNLVARYGGDEFISILSDTAPGGGEQYVNRIQERMAGDPLLGPHGITLSWGVAAFEPHMDAQGLLEAADADLYRRKGSRGSLEARRRMDLEGGPGGAP